MLKKVHVLFAVRDVRVAEALRDEMDDEENCTFQIVSSGRAAIAAAGRFLPDILVVDEVLGGIDGLGLVDSMHARFGKNTPRVIAEAITPFGENGFRRRGAVCVLHAPWQKAQLRSALLLQMEELEFGIDWETNEKLHDGICLQLTQMGMSKSLKGYEYIAWAAALVCENEARLSALSKRVYAPIAERFLTTPQNVERLIRHAVESMMNTGRAKSVYARFGNTIDPARGKPTNAQAIAMMAQWMRIDWMKEAGRSAH